MLAPFHTLVVALTVAAAATFIVSGVAQATQPTAVEVDVDAVAIIGSDSSGKTLSVPLRYICHAKDGKGYLGVNVLTAHIVVGIGNARPTCDGIEHKAVIIVTASQEVDRFKAGDEIAVEVNVKALEGGTADIGTDRKMVVL